MFAGTRGIYPLGGLDKTLPGISKCLIQIEISRSIKNCENACCPVNIGFEPRIFWSYNIKLFRLSSILGMGRAGNICDIILHIKMMIYEQSRNLADLAF